MMKSMPTKFTLFYLLPSLLSSETTTSAFSTRSSLRSNVCTCKRDVLPRLIERRLGLKSSCDNNKDNKNSNSDHAENNMTTKVAVNRRMALCAIATSAVPTGLFGKNYYDGAAWAYERTFPLELDADEAVVKPRRKSSESKKKSPFDTNPIELFLGSVLWGGSLWLLAGSRSNPLATPLANIIYDEEKEPWLKDRNEGLFASLPVPLLLLLGLIFIFLGLGVDILAISASGNGDISLELAGVLLIGGGTLELSRIASGEKKQTREDFDRDTILETEFEQFAEQRLRSGGNCHRSEVVGAFRRFYGKYRQADNSQYPLGDLEIERLLRNWNDKIGKAERTQAGFYYGIQINDQADIFVRR